ncbi:MAG: GntR family transcriptional regulator [Desulfobacula sp.]|nr:GntR family transcriptional regulator [Desulfobacula sp.]
MKNKTYKTKDLTRDAYNDIRKMIFSNALKPGQKIPYRKMAEGLSMSLTPVVQALKHMEFMGLVTHEKNRGFFVGKVTPQQLDEAYRLRSVIEPMMLEHAIPALDEEGLKKINDAMDEYLEAIQKGSAKLMLVKDIQFHMVLAELSNQTISILLLKHLFDFLYLRFSEELIFSRPSENSISDHAAILKAIKSGNINAAAQGLKSHISHTHKNALDGLKDRLAEVEEIIF